MLSNVPKCRKAVIFLSEKIRVLNKLYSGMSVGRELSINESTVVY